MATYQIDVPEGVPADIEVRCSDHGTAQTYPRNRSTVAFHCPDCAVEVTIDLADTEDWRPLHELC